MKIHKNIEQNSVDWQILRSGKITASECDSLVTPKGKVKEGAAADTLAIAKIAELWIGGPLPSFQGVFDVDQGKILEESAKPQFSFDTGIDIENVAFVETDDGRCGCSPDAGIFKDGQLVSGCEIKCPRMETHIRYLLDGKLPDDYVAQVQFSMWVTGCRNWHFYSYRRNFPALHLVIDRDEAFQAAITKAVALALIAIDDGFEKLTRLNGGLPKQSTRGLAPLPKTQSYGERTGDLIP
jgi:hypothetical protein